MLVFSSYGSGKLWQVKARFQALLSVASEQQPCGVQVVEWVGFSCIRLKASYDYIFGSFYFHFAQPLLPLLQHR